MDAEQKPLSKPPLNQQAGASPMPGCIIILITVLVFGGLALLYLGVGYWMNREIDAVTDPQPITLAVPQASPGQVESVYHKLHQLKQATEAGKMVRVSFSADDLNALIASEPLLADLKGKALVEKIDSTGIQTLVNQQIRNLPFRPQRFLNATIAFVPVVLKDSMVFEIHAIQVPGKEVPQGFVEGYSKQDFFKLDSKNPTLEPVLKQLRRSYLEGDHIIVETGRETVDE